MTEMTRSGALGTDRALLVLEDGTIYRGYGYGAIGASLGEAVFSTGTDRLPRNADRPILRWANRGADRASYR